MAQRRYYANNILLHVACVPTVIPALGLRKNVENFSFPSYEILIAAFSPASLMPQLFIFGINCSRNLSPN